MKKILFLLLSAVCAHASLLVYVSDGTKLYSIDGSNGSTLGQQNLSSTGLVSMTFSLDGTLYGLFQNGLNFQLGVINANTAEVTIRPQIAFNGALAFDGTTLYERASNSNILALNPTTGAATGASFACFTFGEGLAFGGDGDAWEGNLNHVAEYAAGGGGSCTGSGAGGSPTGSGYSGPHLRTLSYTNSVMYAIDVSNTTLVSFNGSTFPALSLPTLTTIGSLPAGSTSLAVFTPASAAPEPETLPLMGAALVGLAGFARWARRRAAK